MLPLPHCPAPSPSGFDPSMTASALDLERPPHSSLWSASSWRTVFVLPLTTVVTSALELVSERQPPLAVPELLLLALLLDLAVAFAEPEALTSPAHNGCMAVGCIWVVKPAKRLIVPITPMRDHRWTLGMACFTLPF